ncbi:MAG: hypothetical protein GPOALKHO_001684 [Sodalis sp.]|nr:MAG: hypothetical protein GPOALKHO_001684 [Sodalis sp.]
MGINFKRVVMFIKKAAYRLAGIHHQSIQLLAPRYLLNALFECGDDITKKVIPCSGLIRNVIGP